MGRWQEGGRAVPCGVSTDYTSPLTDEHLGSFQTHVTVRRKQSLPSSYSIDFVQYVSSIGVQSSALFIPCSVHPPIQPDSCPSNHPSIHYLVCLMTAALAIFGGNPHSTLHSFGKTKVWRDHLKLRIPDLCVVSCSVVSDSL